MLWLLLYFNHFRYNLVIIYYFNTFLFKIMITTCCLIGLDDFVYIVWVYNNNNES